MTARYAPAALLAALLHAAVVAALVWFALAARNEPSAVPTLMGPIWEVVSPSPAPAHAPEQGIRVVIPPMPVRSTVQEEPAPMPVVKDSPPVVQPRDRVNPKPQPRPTVKPVRNPGATVKPSPTTRTQTALVRIDETWPVGSPSTSRSDAPRAVQSGTTDRDTPELEAYWAELRQRLRAALQEPPGVPPNLVAKVEFILRADGVLLQPRILSASGSAEFDRAVIEAILRTKMGPRPDGKTGTLTFPFATELKNGR